MAIENFTTYVEEDPDSHITVISNQVTIDHVDRAEEAYVYKDKDPDHFDGDFEHLFEVRLTDDNSGYHAFWALTNDIDDLYELEVGSKNHLHFKAYKDGANTRMKIWEIDGANAYSTGATFGAAGTIYYIKIKRDEAVGDYGTLYLYVYSDAERTDLLGTYSLTLHSSKKDYRYIFAFCAYNDNQPTYWSSGYTKDLDLQEPPAPAGRSHGYIFSKIYEVIRKLAQKKFCFPPLVPANNPP